MLLLAIFLVLFFTVVPLFFTTFFRRDARAGLGHDGSSDGGGGLDDLALHNFTCVTAWVGDSRGARSSATLRGVESRDSRARVERRFRAPATFARGGGATISDFVASA